MKTFLCKTGNLLSAIVNIKFIVKYKNWNITFYSFTGIFNVKICKKDTEDHVKYQHFDGPTFAQIAAVREGR